MNINLENFRTLANGAHNLGFVQLTRENGTLGIDKANNFAHRFWRNRANEEASADNLIVRQKLLQAFADAGACTGFIQELRERLGLNAERRTAEILTREELKDIFSDFDRCQPRLVAIGKSLDALVTAFIPEPVQRLQLHEQIRMLKDTFADQESAAHTITEHNDVLGRFKHALTDLRNTFYPTEEYLQAQARAEEIARQERESELRQQWFARMEMFTARADQVDEIIDNDLERVKHNVMTMPGFNDLQRLVIHMTLGKKICQLREQQRQAARSEMVERNAIDVEEAAFRMRKGWTTIDMALDKVLTDLVVNGVEEGLGDKEHLRMLVDAKFDAALAA